MKCPHCGQDHPDNTKFCPGTGKKIGHKYAPQVLVCQNTACNFRETLPSGAHFCPNCGKSLNTDQHRAHNTSVAKAKFPLYDIVLGETTIEEVADRADLWDSIEESEYGDVSIELRHEMWLMANTVDSPTYHIEDSQPENNLDVWKKIIPIDENPNIRKIVFYCKNNSYPNFVRDDKEDFFIIMPDKGWMLLRAMSRFILYRIPNCPHCGALDWKIANANPNHYCYDLRCNACKKQFGYEVYFKQDSITNDSEDDDCEEIICPECGSNDCEDDGSDYLQYECNDCGHIWGDEDDEEEDCR